MKDFPLSPHFTFYEFTNTGFSDLLEHNRERGYKERQRLRELAQMMEGIRGGLDNNAIEIHSGFRGPELNARVGSSDVSQHLKAEAVDFSLAGPDDENSWEKTFQEVLGYLISTGTMFGQLIKETQAVRGYPRKYWLHLSLGAPYREIWRCGQVLLMKDGRYEILKRIPFGR